MAEALDFRSPYLLSVTLLFLLVVAIFFSPLTNGTISLSISLLLPPPSPPRLTSNTKPPAISTPQLCMLLHLHLPHPHPQQPSHRSSLAAAMRHPQLPPPPNSVRLLPKRRRAKRRGLKRSWG
ncbi:hypothetical protein ACFXTO_033899 [Malus domestica]